MIAEPRRAGIVEGEDCQFSLTQNPFDEVFRRRVARNVALREGGDAVSAWKSLRGRNPEKRPRNRGVPQARQVAEADLIAPAN
jgi:hypothetical protein